MRVIQLASALLLSVHLSASMAAGTLLQYDPKGAQISDTPVPVSSLVTFVSASSLSEAGLIASYTNTGVLPVGLITSSPTINLGQYITFSAAPTAGHQLQFSDLLYDKVSYSGAGATLASLRTSIDGFATNVSQLTLSPAGIQSLDFNLASLPIVSTQVSFRIYFYAAPVNQADWDDLLSTDRGYNGLRLQGTVLSVPELPSGILAAVGMALLLSLRQLGRKGVQHSRN